MLRTVPSTTCQWPAPDNPAASSQDCTVRLVAVRQGRDARVERTVTRVLDAVNRLLKSEGLASVTFGRISRETGVSRTTLYRHWSSPSALISEAWASVAPSKRVAHTQELYDDLVGLFRALRDVVESSTMRKSLPALLVAAQRDPIISSLCAQFIHDRRQPIVERIQAAIADGQIAADADPELVVDMLSGPIFYRQLLRRTRTSDDDVRSSVAAVLASVRPGA
jgi:AcrR family transcriptional regulator